MGASFRESLDGGGKKYATIIDVIQQAVSTVTADFSALQEIPKAIAFALGSNLGGVLRTITHRYDTRARQIVFAGLEGTGVSVASVTTAVGSDLITSSAAFSLTQHEGAAITGTGIPADTYITRVIDTSNAKISKPATAAGTVTMTLFDRIILTLFH